MFHRILLAADPSGKARAVVPALLGLAAGDAEIMVVSVASPVADVVAASREAESATAELLDRGFRVQTRVRSTHLRGTARVIAELAREYDADLVCMGSHGRPPLVSLVLGSTTHSVAARLDCPVLITRAGAPTPARRVLVAIGDAPHSSGAVASTLEMAAGARIEVLVVNILELSTASEPGGEGPHARAHAMVDEAVRALTEAGVPARAWLVPGNGRGIYGEIADAGAEWAADLIVVGSRRLSDLRALLLGSVSGNVARSASMPVLIARRVPHQGRRMPATAADERPQGAT